MNTRSTHNQYTRREFLSMMGIAAAGLHLFPNFLAAAGDKPLQGRALEAAAIYARPDAQAAITCQLWPDSITTILDTRPGWYGVNGGFVQRHSLQPMLPFETTRLDAVPAFPFLAEVSGPVAVVRAFCAANAPLVRRIGHGGVAQIVDYLPGEPFGWYALSDVEGQIIGWSQAAMWRAVEVTPRVSSTDTMLTIDIQTQQLSAWEAGIKIFEVACSTSDLAQPGTYQLVNQQPFAFFENTAEQQRLYNIPWVTQFTESQTISGAYWHNRFGEALSGPAVQVNPIAARWVYDWLSENSTIIIQ